MSLRLGLMEFNAFINDIDSEIKCSSRKFGDDTKTSGAADVPEGQSDIQGDLDRLEAHESHMKFNKTECKVLHVGQGTPQYQYRLGDDGVESSPAMKHLGIRVDEKLDMTHLCVPETQPAAEVQPEG